MQRIFEVINQMVVDGVVENYAIGGAIGASFYIEAGATEDVDIFVHINPGTPRFLEMNGIFNYLSSKGYEARNVFVVIDDWDVQFLTPADGSIESEAVANAVIIPAYGREVRVMMPEYLAAIAMSVGRDKDIDRARAFIKNDKVDIDVLNDLVERFDLHKQWQRVKLLV